MVFMMLKLPLWLIYSVTTKMYQEQYLTFLFSWHHETQLGLKYLYHQYSTALHSGRLITNFMLFSLQHSAFLTQGRTMLEVTVEKFTLVNMWKYYIGSNSGSHSNTTTVGSILSIYYMPNTQLSGFTCFFFSFNSNKL